jgi:hypothetical protein
MRVVATSSAFARALLTRNKQPRIPTRRTSTAGAFSCRELAHTVQLTQRAIARAPGHALASSSEQTHDHNHQAIDDKTPRRNLTLARPSASAIVPTRSARTPQRICASEGLCRQKCVSRQKSPATKPPCWACRDGSSSELRSSGTNRDKFKEANSTLGRLGQLGHLPRRARNAQRKSAPVLLLPLAPHSRPSPPIPFQFVIRIPPFTSPLAPQSQLPIPSLLTTPCPASCWPFSAAVQWSARLAPRARRVNRDAAARADPARSAAASAPRRPPHKSLLHKSLQGVVPWPFASPSMGSVASGA